jgi:hypothetical protein
MGKPYFIVPDIKFFYMIVVVLFFTYYSVHYFQSTDLICEGSLLRPTLLIEVQIGALMNADDILMFKK